MRRTRIPKSTLHYYWKRLSNVSLSNIPLSGYYAVDETKILLVKGVMYYLWVVRDVYTGYVPFIMITETRSGLDVIILVNKMKGIEIKMRKELEDYYIHDGLPAYNFLSIAGVKHEHVKFGVRNIVEQVFRSVKHRLSMMDYHFPWNSSKASLRSWFTTFLLVIFNLTLSIYNR